MTGTAKALLLIRDNEIFTPKEFAHLMWPKSEGWQRVHKVGHGSSRGAAMSLAAGGFLGKLCSKGLIIRRFRYDRDRHFDSCPMYLTDKGKELLRQELPK